jgi:gliding motility-associated lipoprotein GldH
MNKLVSKSLLTILSAVMICSCETMDIFEKTVKIPDHAWDASFRPTFTFSITDTTAFYNIFFVIRHSDAYGYNNIWVNTTSTSPGDTTSRTQRFDFPLATQEKWLGTGMDDIYEHRVLLYREPVKFRRPGTYKVAYEQAMRENPLRHVMNLGLRVEKVKY